MKKKILSLLFVVVMVLTAFTVTASAAGLGLKVAKADLVITHPLDGNKPDTSVDNVKVKMIAPTGIEQSSAYFEVQSVTIMDWEDSTKTDFEYKEGNEYFVVIEIATVSDDVFDVYYDSIPTKEECKINGVQASDVKLKSDSDNKVLIVATILTANKVEDVLDFGQVAPGMSAADETRHQTDLGDIEYGIYTMFGYDIYPLSQAQKDMGYTVEEKIYVNYGGGTLVTRSSGTPFDIMMYVDQLLLRGSNPFSDKWSVWFTVNLFQNDEYVGSIGHIYNFNIVPALVSSVQLNAPKPIVNTAPDNDLGNYSVGGEGYEIVDVDWTDTEGIIMPDQAVFEADKIYECVLQVEPLAGYVFPENKADFSGKINGIEGVVSSNYSSTRAYVTVQFSFSADIAYGDVNGDESINAKDALEVLKAAVNKITLNEEQKLSADVNEDEAINAKDALEILKYAVSKPSALDKFYKE